MLEVITWAAIYLFAMFLGWLCRRMGLFRPEDRRVLANLIFYITLPAMLIGSFGGVSVDAWFLAALGLGMLSNAVMLAAAALYTRRKPPEMQALYLINCAGLNLGNLVMPFLRNFYPGGIPYLCMFDTGDSFFTLGGTYALANMRLGRSTGSKCRSILTSLSRSVPFLVYLLMTALALLGLELPGPVLQAADFIGRGNGFLAMLLVGVSLELRLNRWDAGEVLQMLLLRYACGTVLALGIGCFLPAPPAMRQVLVPAVFAAVPNVALVYTDRLGVRPEIASALNSLSTALMVPVLSAVMLLMD